MSVTIATELNDPRAPAKTLDVSLISDAGDLERLGPEWNALVERTQNEPFYRYEFIRSWIDNFAPRAPLRLLTARDTEGTLVGLLPLVEERVRRFGLSLSQWISPTNVFSCRFDLIACDKGAASRAFFAFLAKAKGWDLLRVTDVPEGGNAWELFNHASNEGFPVGVYESNRSVFITLPDTFESLEQALGGKFRGNLRRRRTLLGKKGTVSIEQIHGGPDLQERLEECYAIEASGWKGQRGEPANLNPNIHSFYSTLAQHTARDGSFSLFQLKLDGRPIAFHYGLTRDGIYSLLMTSYDESLRDCSPGHLLVEEALKICIKAGRREFDFLGCDLEWKRAWSQTSRQHSWLFVFRNNFRGRLLHGIKFRLKPVARRLLANWSERKKAGAEGVEAGSGG